jgi:hypothetical protein
LSSSKKIIFAEYLSKKIFCFSREILFLISKNLFIESSLSQIFFKTSREIFSQEFSKKQLSPDLFSQKIFFKISNLLLFKNQVAAHKVL